MHHGPSVVTKLQVLASVRVQLNKHTAAVQLLDSESHLSTQSQVTLTNASMASGPADQLMNSFEAQGSTLGTSAVANNTEDKEVLHGCKRAHRFCSQCMSTCWPPCRFLAGQRVQGPGVCCVAIASAELREIWSGPTRPSLPAATGASPGWPGRWGPVGELARLACMCCTRSWGPGRGHTRTSLTRRWCIRLHDAAA